MEPEEQKEVDPLELAFKIFSESHLERLKDEYPEMTDEQSEEYLQHQWDRKTFADKIEYGSFSFLTTRFYLFFSGRNIVRISFTFIPVDSE